jgi:TonB-linked SusC/RagA family outer membrane protein
MSLQGKKYFSILLIIAFMFKVAYSQTENKNITGRVVDASTGQALNGVKVTIPGVGSTITSDSGKFEISTPQDNITLMLEGIGYQSAQAALKGRSDIYVRLNEEGYHSAYNTIVTPAGEKTLISVNHSVNFMDGSYKETACSADGIMQGRMAGVNVISRSGDPGAGANIFIRGYQSLNTNNQPLIVVDGVIYDNRDYAGSNITGNPPNNPLLLIDPKDIESITVLKDAVPVYGGKAANGVILINTIRARQAATQIDFYTHQGVNFKPVNLPVMEADDFKVYLTDQLISFGYSGDYVSDLNFMSDDVSSQDYYRYHNNTNWQDEIFSNSREQDYYIRVSGGDEKMRMAASVGYMKKNGIIRQNDLSRYNMRINGDINATKDLEINVGLAFTYNDKNLKGSGVYNPLSPVYLALAKGPIFAPYINNELGTTPNLEDYDPLGVSNPVAILNNMVGEVQNKRFFGTFGFKYNIIRGLSFGSTFNINFDEKRETFFMPDIGVVPTLLPNGVAENIASALVDRYTGLYNDTRVAYKNKSNPVHNYTVIAGIRFNTVDIESDWANAYNTPSDEVMTLSSGSEALRRTGGNIGEWKELTYYMAGDYNMLQKYFLSAGLSLDGSSRFGSQAKGIRLFSHKFGLFPSVNAGWLISSENFMSDLEMIDVLKIRASYGVTGNDDLSNSSDIKYYNTQRYIGVVGIVYTDIPNEHIQWETVKKADFGIDMALFNERLAFHGDIFSHRTENMLVYSPASIISGTDYFLTNDGAMKSNGFELGIASRIINRELRWSAGLGIAHFKDEITSIPENEYVYLGNGFTIAREGSSIGSFYGFRTNGIYASDQEALESGLKNKLPSGELVDFRGGDVKFINFDNSDNIIDNTDMQIIGDATPDLTGYVNSSVSWRGISLDVLFSFSYGNDVYNGVRAQFESMRSLNNGLITVNNRWRYDGQVTDIPRAEYGDPMQNARFSDRWIEDGSYLRLKTITLSYDLPLKQGFFKNAMVFVSANNLITFTKYLGYDPEFSNGIYGVYQGIDTGLTPVYKSVYAGIRAGL